MTAGRGKGRCIPQQLRPLSPAVGNPSATAWPHGHPCRVWTVYPRRPIAARCAMTSQGWKQQSRRARLSGESRIFFFFTGSRSGSRSNYLRIVHDLAGFVDPTLEEPGFRNFRVVGETGAWWIKLAWALSGEGRFSGCRRRRPTLDKQAPRQQSAGRATSTMLLLPPAADTLQGGIGRASHVRPAWRNSPQEWETESPAGERDQSSVGQSRKTTTNQSLSVRRQGISW